jgi:nucleotide-binding universal stress UspA family protein
MTKASRIIVVAAGRESRGRDALALGVALARLRDARLLLAGVYVSPFGAGQGLYESVLSEETARELELLRAHVPAGVEAACRVVGATSIGRGLHAAAADAGGETLVIGPSHLGPAARALRGDVALQAIQGAPCAVAVAPPGYAEHEGPATTMRIGAAYDGSPESEQALEAAAHLARRTGGELTIISVNDLGYIYVDPPMIDAAGVAHFLRSVTADVAGRLDRAREAVGDGLSVSTAMPEGAAAAEIVSASSGLELLVMGSRAYGPVRRVLLGSVSADVVRDARCPVLILPRGVTADGDTPTEETVPAAGSR